MYSTCQGCGRALTPCGTPSLSEKPLPIFQLATYLSFPEERGVFSFSATFSSPGSLKGHFSPPSEGAQEGWAGATMGRKIGPNSSPPPLSPRPHRVFFLPSALSWLGAGEERGRKSPLPIYFFPSFFLLPLSDPRRVSLYVRSPPFVRRRRRMLVVSSSVPWRRRRRPQTIISHTLLYGALLTLLHPSLRTLPRSKSQGGRRGEGEEKRVTPTQPNPLPSAPFPQTKQPPPKNRKIDKGRPCQRLFLILLKNIFERRKSFEFCIPGTSVSNRCDILSVMSC